MFDWFISDVHFGHKAIIDLCHRPFNDVEEMNEAIITNLNDRVGATDRVLWCGDVSFISVAKTKELFSRLKGDHWVTRGNHDPKPHRLIDIGFTVVTDWMNFEMDGLVFKANHFPYRRNINEYDTRFIHDHPVKSGEDFLVHGHTHDLSKQRGRAIHVGVDAWDMKPASRDEVLALAHNFLNKGQSDWSESKRTKNQ